MSNEHDTTETTGARLTEAQVAAMARGAAHYIDQCRDMTLVLVASWVRALLADRAAQVAENARLEAQLDSAHQMLGEVADELTRVEDQSLEMRRLVEAVAATPGRLHCAVGCRVNDRWNKADHKPACFITQARALVATSQTPAAPEGDDA